MKVKLECFLQEISEKTTENDQYPVLTSSKAGLFLQSDYFNKQVASKDNTGYKIIRRGQFTYRAMSDTGEFFPNMLECADVGIVSPAYPVFEIAKPEIIIPEFLKYFFKSDGFQYSIASFAQGSTRTSVKFGKMKTVFINLPSTTKQRQIVDVLDRAKSIISDREQELQKLDELIKARFVELFGDIIVNDRGWGCKPWSEVLTIVNGRNQKEVEDENGKYLICGSGGPMSRATDYLTNENSVIIGRKGNINKPILMREKYWNVDTAFGLEPNTESINVEYLYLYCIFFDFEKLNKAVTIPSLTKADLLKIEMPVPDIDIQKEFATFVHQVDKSKFLEV